LYIREKTFKEELNELNKDADNKFNIKIKGTKNNNNNNNEYKNKNKSNINLSATLSKNTFQNNRNDRDVKNH